MSLATLSPIDAAARLAGRRGRVVLYATRGDDAIASDAFVAAEPAATLIARGRSLVLLDAAGRPARRFTDDPLDAAEAFLAEHAGAVAPGGDGDADSAPEPRVIGYLGYDLARVIEPLPGGAALAHSGPDLWLAAYGAIARWSPGGVEIVGRDAAARARLAKALAAAAPQLTAPVFGPLIADDDAHHIARIERIRDHLATGEVERIHLARRLVARIGAPGDALALFAALAEVAPARCAALLEIDGATLVAAGDERFAAHGAAGLAAQLRATFPAASVTGAPRPRAMQLIDELEPVRRGAYGGAIGHVGAGAACELAVASRVAMIAQGELRIHAGGAIAADSDASAAAALAETEHAIAPWRAATARLASGS
jgi:anthranilate/para-aminobenzoate synthase component I